MDVVREARLYIEGMSAALPYNAVLADEVQDLTPPELKLLRAIVSPGPNDLFLAGDAHQRIYGHMARLGTCGIEIRGRARRLKLNYRTTEQIRTRAVAILEGLEVDDLDGGVDSLRGLPFAAYRASARVSAQRTAGGRAESRAGRAQRMDRDDGARGQLPRGSDQ